MKIRIEVDNKIKENEIIIKCSEINKDIENIKVMIEDMLSCNDCIIAYRGDTQYNISLSKILFFETEENRICAHTIDNIYNVKYRLYELEEFLPQYFMRVSKSTILNINHIYSITHSIASSNRVEFQNTHKQVYVSRYYYKLLKVKLSERRK
ncbi:LytTR family DNA-binding domain-containing protein [Eubacterium multiforme]|uniref:DNA-binding LytR/AlgR family response regulator n=1 Tax=Eubacterium multiforme TaxID=83339 RepID=A0ABT9UXV9_9FIRM|nr:LytTR family DNA-binding domain-containing protein [Eubacterium multiforme]MDQ0151148.1 DNA-binding LytR/AlgR family response regulator [Eubacterium multiforme]